MLLINENMQWNKLSKWIFICVQRMNVINALVQFMYHPWPFFLVQFKNGNLFSLKNYAIEGIFFLVCFNSQIFSNGQTKPCYYSRKMSCVVIVLWKQHIHLAFNRMEFFFVWKLNTESPWNKERSIRDFNLQVGIVMKRDISFWNMFWKIVCRYQTS